jgi:preprotein translocase subunit YajC
MNVTLLLPILLIVGMLFLMTRSNRARQQQAQQIQTSLQPGAGVRTIGGMFALVKSVSDETVELEVAPGVHAIYAKNAVAKVLDAAEYNRIVHGEEADDEDEIDENDDVVEAIAAEDNAAEESITLDKKADAAEDASDADTATGSVEDKAASTK